MRDITIHALPLWANSGVKICAFLLLRFITRRNPTVTVYTDRDIDDTEPLTFA